MPWWAQAAEDGDLALEELVRLPVGRATPVEELDRYRPADGAIMGEKGVREPPTTEGTHEVVAAREPCCPSRLWLAHLFSPVAPVRRYHGPLTTDAQAPVPLMARDSRCLAADVPSSWYMEPLVRRGSIVRRIWVDVDVVLLVFAGAAAEFALNRAVDWLFVSGRLPRDPLGRLISTARYAQRIALGDATESARAIAAISASHAAVERRRGDRIPGWAHRDVLYLLIDYSERAFQALHRPLVAVERNELYSTFRRIGEALRIPDLPANYADWRSDRVRHLERDLAVSSWTTVMYAAYRRELGDWRYVLLRQLQGVLVPPRVRAMLDLPNPAWMGLALRMYPVLALDPVRVILQSAFVPAGHLDAIRSLDRRSEAH